MFYTWSLIFFYSTYVVFKCFGNKVMIVMMKCMGADMHTQTLKCSFPAPQILLLDSRVASCDFLLKQSLFILYWTSGHTLNQPAFWLAAFHRRFQPQVVGTKVGMTIHHFNSRKWGKEQQVSTGLDCIWAVCAWLWVSFLFSSTSVISCGACGFWRSLNESGFFCLPSEHSPT